MEAQEAQWVTSPATQPPDGGNSSSVPLEVDGKEQWVTVATDAGDGITDADLDFEQGKRWAEQQRAAEAE
jgi:hypothetical protein